METHDSEELKLATLWKPSGQRRKERLRRRRRRRRRIVLGFGFFCLLGMCALALRKHPHKPLPPHTALPPLPAVSPYPDPIGIVLHYSETPAKLKGKPVNAAMLEEMHTNDHPDWAMEFEGKVYHIGYHYVILPDGKVEPGRPEHCIGTHARHHNNYLGICLVGAFSTIDDPDWWPQRPTKPQIKALVALCEHLMSKYHIPPEMVKRHRDVNETYCPGGRFPYKDVMAYLNAYAAAHPDVRPPARQLATNPPPILVHPAALVRATPAAPGR